MDSRWKGLLGLDRGLLGAHDLFLREQAVRLALDGSGDVSGELDLGKVDLALDARAVVFPREADLRKALADGAERGGVDMAELTVDRVAAWIRPLRDAAPRVTLLLARSQGEDSLGAVGVPTLDQLRGRRLAVAPGGPGQYFASWLLMRAGLSMEDVRWVDLPSTLDAGLQYQHNIVGDWDLVLRLDDNLIGPTTFVIPVPAAGEPRPVARDPVNLFDLRAGFQSKRWGVTFWSKNLFDKRYNTEYSTGGFLFKGEPRSLGVDVSAKF